MRRRAVRMCRLRRVSEVGQSRVGALGGEQDRYVLFEVEQCKVSCARGAQHKYVL
jgi:hypothetical protein